MSARQRHFFSEVILLHFVETMETDVNARTSQSSVRAMLAIVALGFLIGPPAPDVQAQAVHGTLIDSAAQGSPVAPAPQPGATASTNGTASAPSLPFMTRDGYLQIGFDKLSAYSIHVDWLMNPTNSRFDSLKVTGRIPDDIRSMGEKSVAVQGFVMPLKQENGQADFFLMKNQSWCCFGKPLAINEVVEVRMPARDFIPVMDVPLTVYGTLHVGEKLGDGRILSIYRMDGKKMERPADKAR